MVTSVALSEPEEAGSTRSRTSRRPPAPATASAQTAATSSWLRAPGHGPMLAGESGSGVRADPDRGPGYALRRDERARTDDGGAMTTLAAASTTATTASSVPRRRTLVGISVAFLVALVAVLVDRRLGQRVRLVAVDDQGQLRLRPDRMQVHQLRRHGALRAAGLPRRRPPLRAPVPAAAAWTADVAMLGFTVIGLTIAGWVVSGLAMWHAVDQGEDASIRTLNFIDTANFLPLMMGMICAYVGVRRPRGWRRARCREWLAVASIVLGCLAPLGPLGFVPAMLLPIWVVVVSALGPAGRGGGRSLRRISDMMRRIDLRGQRPEDYRGVVPRADFDVEAAIPAVHAICEAVRTRGLEAILEMSQQYDGVDPDRHPGGPRGAAGRADATSTPTSGPGWRSRSGGCAPPARPSSSRTPRPSSGPAPPSPTARCRSTGSASTCRAAWRRSSPAC